MGLWPRIAFCFAPVCLKSQLPVANAVEQGIVSAERDGDIAFRIGLLKFANTPEDAIFQRFRNDRQLNSSPADNVSMRKTRVCAVPADAADLGQAYSILQSMGLGHECPRCKNGNAPAG